MTDLFLRWHIWRASTRTIAWKGWLECSGKTAAGSRVSTRGASSTDSQGALILTSSSPLLGCTGDWNWASKIDCSYCMFRNGRPFGTCWKLFRCGGCVVGRVDEDGELTGGDLAYIYPDLTTALVGNFKKGELVSGQVSSLVSVRLDYGAIQVTSNRGKKLKTFSQRFHLSHLGKDPC